MTFVANRLTLSCLTNSVSPVIWAAIVVRTGVRVGSESSIPVGLDDSGLVLVSFHRGGRPCPMAVGGGGF